MLQGSFWFFALRTFYFVINVPRCCSKRNFHKNVKQGWSTTIFMLPVWFVLLFMQCSCRGLPIRYVLGVHMSWPLASAHRVCSSGQITDGFPSVLWARTEDKSDPLPSCSSWQVQQSGLIGKAGSIASQSHPGRQRISFPVDCLHASVYLHSLHEVYC